MKKPEKLKEKKSNRLEKLFKFFDKISNLCIRRSILGFFVGLIILTVLSIIILFGLLILGVLSSLPNILRFLIETKLYILFLILFGLLLIHRLGKFADEQIRENPNVKNYKKFSNKPKSNL